MAFVRHEQQQPVSPLSLDLSKSDCHLNWEKIYEIINICVGGRNNHKQHTHTQTVAGNSIISEKIEFAHQKLLLKALNMEI